MNRLRLPSIEPGEPIFPFGHVFFEAIPKRSFVSFGNAASNPLFIAVKSFVAGLSGEEELRCEEARCDG
jgi:hypothetical protein